MRSETPQEAAQRMRREGDAMQADADRRRERGDREREDANRRRERAKRCVTATGSIHGKLP